MVGNDGGSLLSSEVTGITPSFMDPTGECSLSANSDLCESALCECAPLLGAESGGFDSDNAVRSTPVLHSKLTD